MVYVRDQEGSARYGVLLVLNRLIRPGNVREKTPLRDGTVIYHFSKELMAYIEPNDYIEAFNDEEVVWMRVIRGRWMHITFNGRMFNKNLVLPAQQIGCPQPGC